MHYAERQQERPRHEDGCDYGPNRRFVMARHGLKELLYLYGDELRADGLCRRTSLATLELDRTPALQTLIVESALCHTVYRRIAAKLHRFFACEFPTRALTTSRTLILDGHETPASTCEEIGIDRSYLRRLLLGKGNTAFLLTLPPTPGTDSTALWGYQDAEDDADNRTTPAATPEPAGAPALDPVPAPVAAVYFRVVEHPCGDALVRVPYLGTAGPDDSLVLRRRDGHGRALSVPRDQLVVRGFAASPEAADLLYYVPRDRRAALGNRPIIEPTAPR